MKYFYDQKTGFKVQQYADRPNVTHLAFDDYRDIGGGLKMPLTQQDMRGGTTLDYRVTNATENTGLADEIFK